MKCKTILCFVFILFFFPVLKISASVQSFFVPPGQSIRNGDIARMYCLEASKKVMRADNLIELKEIIGNVRVLYANGTQRVSSFSELYNNNNGVIRIRPHDSFEYMQIFFTDESILQITIENEGISLFRDKMTDYEKALTKRNIERIYELEGRGIPRRQIQNILWETKVPITVLDSQNRISIIDYRTYDDEDENDKVSTNFGNTATVNLQRGGHTFLRVDGLCKFYQRY